MSETTLPDLIGSFSLFDDWEDKYRYIIDLGRRVPVMDPALKVDEHFVKGCTSKVWMIAGWRDGRFHFEADSDAQIIRGLIYILMLAYEGQDRAGVESVDIQQIFSDLELDQHLSPNRRNGFFAMVEKIMALARLGDTKA